MNKENIDRSHGDIYPVNAKIQGETFQNISNFINPRMRQLIKKVSYAIEVEYYPELDVKGRNDDA